MATYHAVAGACEAVKRILRANYDPQDFSGAQLDFDVYVAENFSMPMNAGVSIFLYRIYPNGVNRSPGGQILPNGRRLSPRLPVDLHFLLTAWAKTASLQHEIAGWMMRVMEDNATLTSDVLNAYRDGVFQANEAVDIVLSPLNDDVMFHLWEVMISKVYQLSVPYVARMVMLDSRLEQAERGGVVQERIQKYALGK